MKPFPFKLGAELIGELITNQTSGDLERGSDSAMSWLAVEVA